MLEGVWSVYGCTRGYIGVGVSSMSHLVHHPLACWFGCVSGCMRGCMREGVLEGV